MRVLISAQAEGMRASARVASLLAGASGQTLSLADVGVRSLRRQQSQAEVHALRKALLGLGPGDELRPRPPEERVVGYVCRARSLAEGVTAQAAAVGDHVNLTWRSPLQGENDRTLGPRFPVVAGLYEPGLTAERLEGRRAAAEATWPNGPRPGQTSVPQVLVAQVARAEAPTPFEREALAALRVDAVSEELVPVALLAAHLGFRVAAAVVLEETANRAR